MREKMEKVRVTTERGEGVTVAPEDTVEGGDTVLSPREVHEVITPIARPHSLEAGYGRAGSSRERAYPAAFASPARTTVGRERRRRGRRPDIGGYGRWERGRPRRVGAFRGNGG